MTENADVIFVGNKPPMSYVLAIITSLSASNLKEITLKARGQAITTAVDVAEITRNRFVKDLKVSKDCYRNSRDATSRGREQVQNGFHNGDNPKQKVNWTSKQKIENNSKLSSSYFLIFLENVFVVLLTM